MIFANQKSLPCEVIPCIAFAAGLIALISLLAFANAADPEIYKITLTNNIVLIHFDTEANRTYVLQYINALPCGTNSAICLSNGVAFTNWSNMYTGFAFPFTNHYIIPDTRTNGSRFYRLRVTP